MQQIQQMLWLKTYMAFFFLRTMHKTALFTIIYCSFFTDNRFLTVGLPVVWCDMSVQLMMMVKSGRTVIQWYCLRKHAEIKRTCVLLSLTRCVFRLTDRRIFPSSSYPPPPLPHFVPWVACWWQDARFLPLAPLLIEAAITRKSRSRKTRVSILLWSCWVIAALNKLWCSHTTPANCDQPLKSPLCWLVC